MDQVSKFIQMEVNILVSFLTEKNTAMDNLDGIMEKYTMVNGKTSKVLSKIFS